MNTFPSTEKLVNYIFIVFQWGFQDKQRIVIKHPLEANSMEEISFVGISEPKSEHSEFKSRDISDLEIDPLKDAEKRREANKRKRNRSKQPKSGSQVVFSY